MPALPFQYFLLLLCAGWMLVSCKTLSDRDQGNSENGDATEVHVPGDAEEVALEEPVEGVDPLPTFEDPGGDLDLRQLTDMALANSPAFAQAEGNLRVAWAQRKIVGEWQDPQFRGGFSWDDVRVSEVVIPGPGNNDAVRRNEELDTSVRLYPPNPFQIRAEIDKAMAEISYAQYYFKQVGRDIVQEVRRLYQELQFIQEDINLGGGLYRLEMEEVERLEQILDAGHQTRDSVDRQRLRAQSKRGLTSSSRIRFQQVRAELAALVGLADASRIAVRGVPNRPILGFREDTLASLTELAFINNLEMADLDRLQKLAQGDLRAFKAKKIPWISFIEGGRERTYSEHLAINETWSIRLAIDVPIFSLFSKEGDVYREQIRSYQNQVARFEKQIRRRVASAVANIKETRSGLGQFDSETGEMIADLEKIESDLGGFPQRQAEVAHRRNMTSLERSKERLKAEEAYHDALLALEELIRTDIEVVFDQVKK